MHFLRKLLPGKRALAATALAAAAVTLTPADAFAASSHQFAKWGTATKGEAWFNSGACCIPQRNSFTVKDWLIDGFRIRVDWQGARTGTFWLPDGTNREATFSIAGDVTRAAIQWRTCVGDVVTGLTLCGAWVNDAID